MREYRNSHILTHIFGVIVLIRSQDFFFEFSIEVISTSRVRALLVEEKRVKVEDDIVSVLGLKREPFWSPQTRFPSVDRFISGLHSTTPEIKPLPRTGGFRTALMEVCT